MKASELTGAQVRRLFEIHINNCPTADYRRNLGAAVEMDRTGLALLDKGAILIAGEIVEGPIKPTDLFADDVWLTEAGCEAIGVDHYWPSFNCSEWIVLNEVTDFGCSVQLRGNQSGEYYKIAQPWRRLVNLGALRAEYVDESRIKYFFTDRFRRALGESRQN